MIGRVSGAGVTGGGYWEVSGAMTVAVAELVARKALQAFVMHLDGSGECRGDRRGACVTCYRLAAAYLGARKQLAELS